MYETRQIYVNSVLYLYMSETPSLLEQVKRKRDSDDTFTVHEEITDQATKLHQFVMELLQAKGMSESDATKRAHELLQLDPEYTDLIGGTFSEKEAREMEAKLLQHVSKEVLQELEGEVRSQFESVLKGIIEMNV